MLRQFSFNLPGMQRFMTLRTYPSRDHFMTTAFMHILQSTANQFF